MISNLHQKNPGNSDMYLGNYWDPEIRGSRLMNQSESVRGVVRSVMVRTWGHKSHVMGLAGSSFKF